jgi:hypothetical protein
MIKFLRKKLNSIGPFKFSVTYKWALLNKKQIGGKDVIMGEINGEFNFRHMFPKDLREIENVIFNQIRKNLEAVQISFQVPGEERKEYTIVYEELLAPNKRQLLGCKIKMKVFGKEVGGWTQSALDVLAGSISKRWNKHLTNRFVAEDFSGKVFNKA